MTDWDFIYNPRSDSWEIMTNEAFATKELAQEKIDEIQSLKSQLEEITKFQTEFLNQSEEWWNILNKTTKLESKNEKLQKVIDEIRELHDNIDVKELDSQTIDILNELKSILEEVEKKQ